MTGVTYGADRVVGTTKNKLRQDADGYYDLIVGAFDVYNSAGQFYTMASARSHFDQSHDFQRRIRKGRLYGEASHPAFTPGMTKEQLIMRILTIDPKKFSHHFKEIRLEEGENQFDNHRDGGKCITTYARLRPSVEALANALDNPHENVAFSIRSITEDHYDPRRGCKVKDMKAIVTYDWVPEPGIEHAGKWDHPGLESLDLGSIGDRTFTHSEIKRCATKMHSMEGIGCEDDSLSRLDQLVASTRPQKSSVALAGASRPGTWGWR